MAIVFKPGKVTCMEATKLFMTQNLLDCHILPGELAFSNVGCPLTLYLGRQSHKSDPTNPGTDCSQCHAHGKGQYLGPT